MKVMAIVKWKLIHGFYLPWLWLASVILSGSGVLWLAGCGRDRSAGARSVPTRCRWRSGRGSAQHLNPRMEHVPACPAGGLVLPVLPFIYPACHVTTNFALL